MARHLQLQINQALIALLFERSNAEPFHSQYGTNNSPGRLPNISLLVVGRISFSTKKNIKESNTIMQTRRLLQEFVFLLIQKTLCYSI